jgi:type IV pilus assembly protein PilY1
MTASTKKRFIALVLLAGTAGAEDIDLYAGATGSNDLPNVLIIMDSSANWSSSIPVANCYYKDNGVVTVQGPKATNPNKEQGTKMAIEKCALNDVIDALPTGPGGTALFNVGVMLFNESPAANSGGYPRVAMQPLTAVNKAAFKTAIRSLGINNDKGNNAAFAKALYEAYLYFKAATPHKGTAGSKWDPLATVGGLPSGNYNPPLANGCGKNHIIFIANGGPGEVTNNEAKALLAALGGNTTLIDYPNSYVSNSDEANWADEFARFMYSGADVSTKDGLQSIQTHAVAVLGASSDGLYPNFMDSIAKFGGSGRAVRASDAGALAIELQKIFTQIQSVSSVFASASLPISVNARGTYLNQIFMGMFLPDGASRPRWDGNLKQYKFTYTQATDTLQLADQFDNPAIDGSTGFIKSTATSFWTHNSNFWSNAPSGVPASPSDSPDGAIIAKGAAAQALRDDFDTSQTARRVYTCLGCPAGSALTPGGTTSFEDGNAAITAGVLGVATAADRTALINWTRGTDNAADEAGPGGTTTVRPSLHGDVLHSRPAAINYGGSTGVVIYYGANDGMLHAVNGNQTGGGAGSTLWSFVPEEVLGRLNRFRNNSPLIAFPTTPLALGATRRDYFVDGPVSVYQKLAMDGSTEKAYLYVGMRRGGRMLYAFDVTLPTAPMFLWKVSSATLPILGQTWSEARVAKVRGHANPVIVMGGGYDAAAEDATPSGAVAVGNTILVLDAITGALIKQFGGVDRPVPADVSLVDSDFDGYIDRGYGVDLGGNIYRIDFEVGASSAVTDWTINKLAALGSSGGNKLFYAPDVVLTRSFTVVLVGSGDREKPLETTTANYFYTVLDKHLDKGVGPGFATLTFADLKEQALFASPATDNGCYVAMDTAGEKVVNAPLTIGGSTYFGTNRPQTASSSSCASNLGQARTYSLPLICGKAVPAELNGGGLPPSPVAGIVTVSYRNPDGSVSERQMPFCIGCGANSSPIEGEKIKLSITPKRSRRYWFYE